MSATATKYLRALGNEEKAASGGYTHRIDLTWEDLYGVTIGASGTMTITIGNVAAASNLVKAHLHVGTPFSDASDTALLLTTFDFGDTGSATRYFSAVETNLNGTYVVDSIYTTGNIYTAADTLKVVFHVTAGKDLTNIDNGKLYLEIQFLRYSGTLKNAPQLPPHI